MSQDNSAIKVGASKDNSAPFVAKGRSDLAVNAFKPGDRVTYNGGPGTITCVGPRLIFVRIDADVTRTGKVDCPTVKCAPGDLTPIKEIE